MSSDIHDVNARNLMWCDQVPSEDEISEALRAAARRAQIDEREACAKLAEDRASTGEHGTWQAQEGLIIAAEIRARSNSAI